VELVSYLAMLRRRWLVIALCIVAGLAGGYDLGHRGTKEYRASAQCLVNIPVAGSVEDALAASQLTSNLVETYATLVTSQELVGRAERILQGQGIPPGEIGSLSAGAETGSYLITITAQDSSPMVAQATANAAATALVDAVALFQQGAPAPISIKITTHASLPAVPVSPRPGLDLTVGLILGLLVGLGLAGALEALDRTVKTVAQADLAFEAPLLGLVPRRRSSALVFDAENSGPDGEPYRSLRTAVRFLGSGQPLRTLLITSPTPGDGKTTTAANLAVALALSGERVVVVDADLRLATLAGTFGLERAIGLTTLVLGRATIDDVLQEWRPGLSVMASGPLPPNPSEILGSQLTNSVLKELVKRSDIVIIDAPPVLPVADAVALAAQVDGVILVARHGGTLRISAAESRRRLEAVGANIVGYVLNGVPRSEVPDYYGGYDPYEEVNVSRPAREASSSGPPTRDVVPAAQQSRVATLGGRLRGSQRRV